MRLIPLAVGSAIAGYLALAAPWWVAVLVGGSSAPNPIDGLQPVSLLLLSLVGLGFGLVAPGRCWVGGVFSMSLFPLFALWDTVRDPTSHNLFPLELIFYVALTIPGILGGLVGGLIARAGRWNQRRDDPSS